MSHARLAQELQQTTVSVAMAVNFSMKLLVQHFSLGTHTATNRLTIVLHALQWHRQAHYLSASRAILNLLLVYLVRILNTCIKEHAMQLNHRRLIRIRIKHALTATAHV